MLKISKTDNLLTAGIVLLAVAGLAAAAAHTEPSRFAPVTPWAGTSEYVSALPEAKDLAARHITNISVRCEQDKPSKVLRVQVDYLMDGNSHTIQTAKTCRNQGLAMLFRPSNTGWTVQSATKYNRSDYADVVSLVHQFSTPRT